MKGKLFGKKGSAPTSESSQGYTQSSHSQDSRPNIPPQYQRVNPNQPIPPNQDSQQAHIARSPSQRHPSQPINLETQYQSSGAYNPHQQQGFEEQQGQRQADYRHSQYISGIPAQQGGAPTQQHQPEEEKRRGLRDRLFKSSKDHKGDQLHTGVGRTLSKRGKHSPNPETAGQPWSRQQNNSSQLLLSPTEEDEDAPHNRVFAQHQQQQFGRQPNPNPHQDAQLDQAYSPHPGSQDYYPPPGSQQIPQGQYQNQLYRQQGSSAEELHLSPEQQLQLQQQQLQLQQQHLKQGGQYTQYQEPPTQSQQAPAESRYQQYPPPQSLSAPGQGHTQPAGPPPGYQYAANDQQQQHSPEEGSNQFAPQVRVSSEEQGERPEILQPQATRPTASQKDAVYLNAPTGAQPGHSPPSPFPGQGSDQSLTNLPPQPPSPVATQGSAPSPMPPPSRSGQGRQDGKGTSTQAYRGPPPPQDSDLGKGDRGSTEITEDEVAHYHQLKQEHKELKEKYQKVKKYYFEKESQVHQLQNTLANQRLSASKTSLDDSEYSSRFSRLDGLISQLAFSIRKNWVTIPQWMHPAVNKDAMATGKQEMTAVGRAFISRWLYLELFECIFHPNLDINLSFTLKRILNNLRVYAPPCSSAEEEEALSAKLSSWRLSTLEGLTDQLRAPVAEEHRQELLRRLNMRLVSDISAYLTDPPPPDLNGGVIMITELAANIVMHLPQESREVSIEYYMPMYPVLPDLMKLESGIPPLTAAIAGDDDADSTKDTATTGASDAGSKEEDGAPPPPPHKDEPQKGSRRNMLASFINPGKQGGAQPPQPGHKPGASSGNAQIPGNPPVKPNGSNGRDTPSQQTKQEVVRMAVGLGVVIRNRSVLVKAPVFTTLA